MSTYVQKEEEKKTDLVKEDQKQTSIIKVKGRHT